MQSETPAQARKFGNRVVREMHAQTGKDYRLAYSRSGRKVALWEHKPGDPAGIRITPWVPLEEFMQYLERMP